jgi:hypothetical protein
MVELKMEELSMAEWFLNGPRLGCDQAMNHSLREPPSTIFSSSFLSSAIQELSGAQTLWMAPKKHRLDTPAASR